MKYIEQIHADSRGTYGSPRVHAELTLGAGLSVNRKRVARLMRQAGIQGLYRRKRSWTTVRDPAAEPAPDLVNRHFTVDGPDRLWITDTTEHPTEEGKVYRAAVMDAYSRLIIGWSIDNHMAVVFLLHKEFVAITLDREMARAMGLRVFWLEILLYVLVTLAVVISVQTIGNILVRALLITRTPPRGCSPTGWAS